MHGEGWGGLAKGHRCWLVCGVMADARVQVLIGWFWCTGGLWVDGYVIDLNTPRLDCDAFHREEGDVWKWSKPGLSFHLKAAMNRLTWALCWCLRSVVPNPGPPVPPFTPQSTYTIQRVGGTWEPGLGTTASGHLNRNTLPDTLLNHPLLLKLTS